MAYGDDRRARNQIDYQGKFAQNNLNNERDELVPQNQLMYNAYSRAVDRQEGDYSNLMGGYNQFAKTGGFSPMDLANIRARSISPIRAAYSNANREVDRSRALQGGYSPNFAAAKSRMAREQSSSMSDAAQNAEGMIAQLLQSGKLAGMSGASNLYGTAPGQVATMGNQLNQSWGNRLNLQQMQNQLGLGIMGAQNQAAQLPGRMESIMGNIKTGADIGAGISKLPWGSAPKLIGANFGTPNTGGLPNYIPNTMGT